MSKSPEMIGEKNQERPSWKQNAARVFGAALALTVINPTTPANADIDNGSGTYVAAAGTDNPNRITIKREYPECEVIYGQNGTVWVTEMVIDGETYFDKIYMGRLDKQCDAPELPDSLLTNPQFETICHPGSKNPSWEVTAEGVSIQSRQVHPDVLGYTNWFVVDKAQYPDSKAATTGKVVGKAILHCQTISGRQLPIKGYDLDVDVSNFTPTHILLENARKGVLPPNSVYQTAQNRLDPNGGQLEILAIARCNERYEGSMYTNINQYGRTAMMGPIDIILNSEDLQQSGQLQAVEISLVPYSNGQPAMDLPRYETYLTSGLYRSFDRNSGRIYLNAEANPVIANGFAASVYDASYNEYQLPVRGELLARVDARILCPQS